MKWLTARRALIAFLTVLLLLTLVPIAVAAGASVQVETFDYTETFPTTGVPCTDYLASAVVHVSGVERTVHNEHGRHRITDVHATVEYTVRGDDEPSYFSDETWHLNQNSFGEGSLWHDKLTMRVSGPDGFVGRVTLITHETFEFGRNFDIELGTGDCAP